VRVIERDDIVSGIYRVLEETSARFGVSADPDASAVIRDDELSSFFSARQVCPYNELDLSDSRLDHPVNDWRDNQPGWSSGKH